ncbi:MAG: hypothetical protein FK731_04310 [Asgard group archaeon]|nr:hypothetical protein [Asgard group archaeon]
MTEKKKSRGRPRIHETNAARKKAYRERKKAERLKMEERIKELESKLIDLDSIKEEDYEDDLMNLTYHQLGILKTDKLEDYLQKLEKRFDSGFSINNIFNMFQKSIDEFKQNAIEYETKKIIQDVDEKFQKNRKQLHNIILHQMINFELTKRKDAKFVEIELDLIEERIKELEKKISKEKEVPKRVITKED